MHTATNKKIRYSVSLVTQGSHRFYTFTAPTEVLASCCFVSNRFDDPTEGFQRRLDTKRAQEIADYIDSGFGTIPSAVVLSAQQAAEFQVVGNGKSIEFSIEPKSFLVLDGQHRIYGFSLAKTSLRVPVVVYNGLSREQEARLFIDINTKQRPVPNELLLDIRQLAAAESDDEQMLRQIFDLFDTSPNSALAGKMSKSTKASGKLSRVTFNLAFKPLIPVFSGADVDAIYGATNSYINAAVHGLNQLNCSQAITNPIVFRSFMIVFTEAAQRVNDRHGKKYSTDNFFDILSPIFEGIKASAFTKPGTSVTNFAAVLSKKLKTDFVL